MFVHLDAEGKPLETLTFPGEESFTLRVAFENRAYYIFVENEQILGVIPVSCGDCKYPLAPKVAIEKLGARVVFYNVNGKAIPTEFFALVLVRDAYQEAELPTVADVYKKLSAIGRSPTVTAKLGLF